MAAPSIPVLHAAAIAAARKYGVDPNIFTRQIGQESGWNPAARSSAGAQGIAQFMPGTAKSYGIDPMNPLQSLDAAARYDATELKAFGGDYHKALAAYNAGAGNAGKWNDPNFASGQTYNYVQSILGGSNPSVAPPQPTAPLAAAPVMPGAQNSSIRPALTLLGFQAPPQVRLPQAPTVAASQARPVAVVPGNGQLVGNTAGEQPQFVNALTQLAAFEHAPVSINSGYRSTQKQAQLYANRASNPNPVAAPGHSLHEQGLAADGTVGGIPLGTLPDVVLARFGLEKVPGDPVHVQMRRG